MNNVNLQNVLRFVVIAGGAVITIQGAMELFKTKIGVASIMPIVTMVVGVSAFSYAMQGNVISMIPKA